MINEPKKRRRWLVAIPLVMISLLLLAGMFWSKTPISADRSSPDPAVTYLNSRLPSEGTLIEGYFTHGGQSLHYVSGGSGQTIVFLHGFPSYWFSFLRQIEALAGRYRIIAIDGLGAGRSDAPVGPGRYQLETMSADVIALLDHLDVDRAHLVGHDWGAAFALGMAQRHPDRVISVTGISAPPHNILLKALHEIRNVRARGAYVERLKQAGPLIIVATGGHKRVWTGAYEPLVRSGYLSALEGKLFRKATGDPRRINAHINWYRANIPAPDEIDDSSYWPSRSARLTVPSQILWGSADPVFADEYAAMIAQQSDNVTLTEIPGVGHWPHIEKHGLVTEAIVRLVERSGRS